MTFNEFVGFIFLATFFIICVNLALGGLFKLFSFSEEK